MREPQRTGAARPGRVSGEVLRGSAGPTGRDYHIIYRFTDTASLMAWETSDERQAIVRRLAPLMTETGRKPLTGLEAWFELPGGTAPPPRGRMALITWIGIWPVVSLALWQLVPRLDDLPFLLRTGVTTGIVVLIMTYLVMPRLARIADPWLRGSA